MTAALPQISPDDAPVLVAGSLLRHGHCSAVRLLPPGPDGPTAGAHRNDAVHRVRVETRSGRRFYVTVAHAEAEPRTGVSDVPGWAFPGPFGDALAAPDPRHWVALTAGPPDSWSMWMARDHVIRRLVFARYIEAISAGIPIRLKDDVVILDLGLDIAAHRGLVASTDTMFDEVEASPLSWADTNQPL